MSEVVTIEGFIDGFKLLFTSEQLIEHCRLFAIDLRERSDRAARLAEATPPGPKKKLLARWSEVSADAADSWRQYADHIPPGARFLLTRDDAHGLKWPKVPKRSFTDEQFIEGITGGAYFDATPPSPASN